MFQNYFLGYVIVLRRINDYGAPLVPFYDTLGIRRTYYRLKPPASSRGKISFCFKNFVDNYLRNFK